LALSTFPNSDLFLYFHSYTFQPYIQNNTHTTLTQTDGRQPKYFNIQTKNLNQLHSLKTHPQNKKKHYKKATKKTPVFRELEPFREIFQFITIMTDSVANHGLREETTNM
jgi:hypothetical protein